MIAEMLKDMILDELFISSSVLILMVILVRFLFRNKISRRVQYALWLVVLVRLLVPVQIGQLSFSTSAMAEKVEQAVVYQESTSYAPVYEQTEVKLEPFEVDGYAHTYETVEGWQVPRDFSMPVERANLVDFWYGLWFYIMVALGLWFVLTNLIFRRRATKNMEAYPVPDCPVPVYVSQGLTSPCLIGLFWQKILLPEEAIQKPENLKHIISHEMTHRRHGDLFWGLLRCVLLCYYWNYPLVWLAAFLSKKDCELACDEGAIAKLGEEERIPYGETLLKVVALSSVSRGVGRVATTMAESKKQLAQRILCIAKKRKIYAVAVVAALCLTAAMIPITFAGKAPDPGEGFVRLFDAYQKEMKKPREELPKPQVQEGSIYEAYGKALTQTEYVLNYTMADLNDDGVPELALLRSNGFTFDYAFYSYKDGTAIPLSYDLPDYPERSEQYDMIMDYHVSLVRDNKRRICAYVDGRKVYALHLQEETVMAEQITLPESDDFSEQFDGLPEAAPFDFSLLDEVILGKKSRKTFDLPEKKLAIPENWMEIRRDELDKYVYASSDSPQEYDVITDGESLGVTDGGDKYIPNVLYLEDGRLEGWDRGSWGGGVRYRADNGETTALILDDFICYYVVDGRIFIVTGLKSVELFRGAFYEIYKEDGEYKAKQIYGFEDSPLAVTIVEDYCFVVTNWEIYVFHGDKIERITPNKGFSLFDSYYWYSENIIYANGCLYFGKCGHVMAFDINNESFKWYICKEQ